MMTDNATVIEIIESQSVGDRLVVVGQLLRGDVWQGMYLQADCGARYEVAGIGFASVEGHKAGRRAMTLTNLGQIQIEVGDRLHSAVE